MKKALPEREAPFLRTAGLQRVSRPPVQGEVAKPQVLTEGLYRRPVIAFALSIVYPALL